MGEIIDPTMIRWGRVRDDASEAKVTIDRQGAGRDCLALLADVRSVRHELVIERNGVREWEGPITLIEDSHDSFSISATDICFWYSRTVVRHTWSSAKGKTQYWPEKLKQMLVKDMEDAEDEMGLNVTGGIHAIWNKDSARTAGTILPYTQELFTVLDNAAARGGIDYTVWRRDTYIWDTSDPSMGQTRVLTPDDFVGDFTVVEYGKEVATRYYVTSSNKLFAMAEKKSPYYGKVELTNSAYGETEDNDRETSQAALDSQAERNIRNRNIAPVVIRISDNSQLKECVADELMPMLVPGVYIPVRSTNTVRKLSQMQKLDSVKVEETENGESVSLSMGLAPGVTPEEMDETT